MAEKYWLPFRIPLVKIKLWNNIKLGGCCARSVIISVDAENLFTNILLVFPLARDETICGAFY